MSAEKDPYTPKILRRIQDKTRDIGFDMASGPEIGRLLKTLAGSKPEGNILELGTGTGLSAAWIIDGMQAGTTLVSIDNNPLLTEIAHGFLGHSPGVSFKCTDAALWLHEYKGEAFDLVFADAWPGKYSHLEELLALLKPGGIYIIDDMDEQPNWPNGHRIHVQRLLTELEDRTDLNYTWLNWATGVILAVKI